MPHLTEATAEQLTPEQSIELVRILDLHAVWDNHRNDPSKSSASFSHLDYRQKAFHAFQTPWQAYAAKYPNLQLPVPTQTTPDRLATWCGVLRVLFRQAEGLSLLRVMAKVYRLADVIAAKMNEQPVLRTSAENLAEAMRELEVVISWCDRLAKPPAPLSIQLKIYRPEAA